MVSISTLRTFVNNGWTIANRKSVVSEIGKKSFNEISELATKTGRTGDKIRYNDAKEFLQSNTISETQTALTNTDVAYHGSPFLFDFFDAAKIGSGEGINKYCKGLYLARTKRIAPFYANIRSKDAPTHLGSTKALEQTTPTVYTVGNIDNLNLKLCSSREAKVLKDMQAEFQQQHPEIDGIELLNGQITVFPEAINKLNITDRKGVVDFVKSNKECVFRAWTTDKTKLNSIYE